MKTLSVIKKDLEFNKGLSTLIEVLKNLAAAQYHILEQKIKIFQKFIFAIEDFVRLIKVIGFKHPFLEEFSETNCVVAVTSDTGLLGGINMQVILTAKAELENKNGRLIVIGERGKMYASEGRFPFVWFSGIVDEERFAQAMQLRNYIIEKFYEGAFSGVKVVYPHPVSFTIQKVQTVTLLPFCFENKEKESYKVNNVIVESKMKDIIEYLAYLWLGQKLYDIFGLSRLAEFAARYVHLEESLQKLKDLDNKLRLQYFKARHELIDRNMRELFSARLVFS
ncbi:MAG: F0F1 ATP synthase subunit gamma [Candidatus Omnitrophica bacterium]|nr:F0F1 ATP synthase subunit gamma [Candidatus Omnitrophota bacterium]